jgi:putative OPT family oligopeptide transporter
MVIAFFLCFLFTPVAAEAIAIVGVNPVSGMTLVTVVISSIVMATVGLSGKPGIFVTLIIGTAVCTALSTSGALISDFKIGYWIGATPRNQQIWKFLGLAVASLVVAVVIPLMDQGYHFLVEKGGQLVSNEDVLPAPQANMISAVVKGLMGGEEQPYLLYGVGGILSIVVTILGLPTLAFALGLYLSISLTSAQLVGGLVAWLVGRSGRDERVREARKNQGTLIASGMIAGAAIFGILSALMRLKETGYAVKYLSVGVQFHEEPGITGEIVLRPEGLPWFEGLSGQLAGIVMFVLLGVLTYLIAKWGAEKEIQG